MSQLQDNLNEILRQKNAYIIPANIRSGVEVLGVTGSMEPDKPDQTKTCTPTTSQQVISADTGYELTSVTVNGVTASIDANIVAGNIKSGVSILGVNGSYSGILTRIQTILTRIDLSSAAEESKTNFTALNFPIYFNLPITLGNKYYMAWIVSHDGVTWKRFIAVNDERMTSTVNAGWSGGSESGTYYERVDTWCGRITGTRFFKYNDITNLNQIVSGFGADELGVECTFDELSDYLVNQNDQYFYVRVANITSSSTTPDVSDYSIYNFLGQNNTSSYHNPNGQLQIITDRVSSNAVMTGKTLYSNTGTAITGTFIPPFKTVNTKGIQFDGDVTLYTNINNHFARDKDFMMVLPSSITLAGKYYVIIDKYDNMMERYEHDTEIIIGDDPLKLKIWNYYEINGENQGGSEIYLHLFGEYGKNYTHYSRNVDDIEGWEYLKFASIFMSNDVDYAFANTTGWSNAETITPYYGPSSGDITNGYFGSGYYWGYRENDYSNIRLITNCPIVTNKNETNINLTPLIVKSDLGNTQQFIDIDGSIVTGTGTTSLTPAEVEQAENTSNSILAMSAPTVVSYLEDHDVDQGMLDNMNLSCTMDTPYNWTPSATLADKLTALLNSRTGLFQLNLWGNNASFGVDYEDGVRIHIRTPQTDSDGHELYMDLTNTSSNIYRQWGRYTSFPTATTVTESEFNTLLGDFATRIATIISGQMQSEDDNLTEIVSVLMDAFNITLIENSEPEIPDPVDNPGGEGSLED